MLMKKIFAAVAVAVVMVTASSVTAFAYDPSAYIEAMQDVRDVLANAEEAETKPTISIDQIEIAWSEDLPGSVQTVEVTISGADRKYASTGLHIVYDKRLMIEENVFGSLVSDGMAIHRLSYDATMRRDGVLFVATSGVDDDGRDGVMYIIQYRIPDGAKPGDVYPIGIEYITDPIPCFTNSWDNDEGRAMQDWVFTQGIQDGYIKITDSAGGSEAPTPSTDGDNITPGDANCDGEIDLADAVLIMQYTANPDKYGLDQPEGLSSQGSKNADVAGDNDGVTNLDALAIQQYKLGLIESLPVKE